MIEYRTVGERASAMIGHQWYSPGIGFGRIENVTLVWANVAHLTIRLRNGSLVSRVCGGGHGRLVRYNGHPAPRGMGHRETGDDMKIELTDFDGAKLRGFAPFNDNAHLCVELDGESFTITCRTPRGKLVTFAFVKSDTDDYECADVQYVNSPGPKVKNGDRKLTSFHMIGFTVGTDTFDTRSVERPTTLATVLLSDRHYS